MALASCFWCATGSSQTTDPGSAADLAERQVTSVFATSVVLTDTEAVTFGFLSFDLEGDPDWLKNLGISARVNYGSALSGGSLVLLYNEGW